MQHTASYSLSQWDSGDRILRTDFNSDNAKIDAALAAMPYRKLKEITTTASATQVDIDLSGLDLTQYRKLDFFMKFAADTYKRVMVRINNDSTASYRPANSNSSAVTYLAYLNADSAGGSYPGGTAMEWVLGNGIASFGRSATTYGGGDVNVYSTGVSPASVTAVNLVAADAGGGSGTVKAGSTITIYGVRA